MSDQEIIPQVPGDNAEPEQKPRKAKEKAPGLPEQSSVNPDKITRAVLTKDGYVVPRIIGKKAS